MLNLSQISLRRGPKLLFENASFRLAAGERLGLIGANGSGKTSLMAMLLGELEADDGDLVIDPDDVIAHVAQESPRGDRAALDFVMDGDAELRNVENRIAATEGKDDSTELAYLHERMDEIDGYSAESRAARLLGGLGFVSAAIRDPVDSFSGGWRMRLNLARALMCRSDILLLDEPTNHLDLPTILWLERWLARYEGILIVISHDRDFLDAACTRIAHIEQGEVRLYTGNYSEFEKLRAAQLALQQAMYVKQQRDIKHLQSFVDRFRYKESKARQAQSRLKMIERMTHIAPAHVDSPFRFRFLEPKKMPQHLLSLVDATLGYETLDAPVLEKVGLNVSAGDRVGLLGVNGAGKSTLVKALADGSTMLSGDRELARHARIGYFAQHQLDLLTPAESPMAHLREIAPGVSEQELRNFLGGFAFSGDRIFEPVAPFSGGEKARLVLALLIWQKPNLLLLDEPTNHLDLEMRQALSVALIEYTGALVVISHDRHLLRSVCDDLLIVHDGEVERFDRSLDDYSVWLREQASRSGRDRPKAPTAVGTEKRENKKRQRQQDAKRRKKLKPLTDRVAKIESALTEHRAKLADVEKQLADPDIYQATDSKDHLAELGRQRTTLAGKIESLEWDWLKASEALEAAS